MRLSGKPGAPLRLVHVDGEPYLSAADVSGLLHALSAHWRGMGESLPAGVDGREVAGALADLLTDQAREVDFGVIAVGLAS
jgi:hypothetical protein